METKERHELHLFFLDSNNHKRKEVLRNVRPDLTGEEVQEAMRTMVALDRPLRSGIRKHTQALAAKMVVVKETILFEVAPQQPASGAPAAVVEVIKDKPKKKAPTKKRAPKTEVSLSDMTRLNPMTVVGIMKNDLEINGTTDENVDRYISNALISQAVSNLMPVGKKIDPRIFGPALREATCEKQEWSREMVGQLDQLAVFFPAPEWLAVMEQAQTAARKQAARLFRRDGQPDQQRGDQYLQDLLKEAREKCAEYREAQRAFPELLAQLLAS